MSGICNGCKSGDLVIDCVENLRGEKEWFIRCLHRNACDEMEAKTIKRMAKMKTEGEEINE
jgi:hypothetical protein